MPNIPTFNAPALDIRPTETGIDAYQQAARRTGAFYNEAGQSLAQTGARVGSAIKSASELAVQVQEHAEISSGSKNFASLFDNLTQQWNDIASKTPPERVGIAAAQFREQTLEPALQKFGDQGFITDGGQRFAQNHIATLRQHMFEKTAADASTAAGDAVKVNTAQTINQLASAARLDPSSLDFSLKTAESTFENLISSGGLTGDLAARLRTDGLQQAKVGIVKSAVMGLLEKNPNADLSSIQKKYSDLISGPEMSQFIKAQKAEQRRERLDNHQEEVYRKQEAQNNVHLQTSKLLVDSVTFGPDDKPIIKPGFDKALLGIVKNNPNAPNGAANYKEYSNWYEDQQTRGDRVIRTNEAVKADLMGRMFDPDKPTTVVQVLTADANHDLSPHDFRAVHALATELEKSPIRGPQYQTAIDAAKERVGYGILADGHERFSNAMAGFYPEYMKALKTGTLKANALDLRDPTSLLSQSIKQYEPDAQTKMMAHSLKLMGLKNLEEIGGIKLPGIPGATPKPAAPVPALPPPDERKKGQIYPTARGQMKWTGVDWVKP